MYAIATEFTPDSWLWSMTVRSTVALGATTVISWLLRRNSAALRHRVWVLGLGASVLIPIVSFAFPMIPMPVLAGRHGGEAQQAVEDTNDTSSTIGEVTGPTTVGPEAPSSQVISAAAASDNRTGVVELVGARPVDYLGIKQIVVQLWLVGLGLGVGTFVLVYAGQAWQVSKLSPVSDPCWQQSVEKAAKQLGLRRKVSTVVADRTHVPAAFGVIGIKLIVPANWRSWPVDQRDCILLHELAHVHRRDMATQVLARLAVLVQWFNPLAWYAARRIRIERELASDDCVLLTGFPPSSYAQHLLLTVKQYRPQPMPMGVAMAHSARLDDRVKSILDPQKNRNAVGHRAYILTAAFTVVACIALGAITPTTAAVSATGLQSDSEAPVWKKGHTYYYSKTLPTSLVFAPDGKSLLAADATGTIQNLNLQVEGNSYLWSTKVAGFHPALAYSLDGKSIYATCDDGVVVFDAQGKEVGRIEEKNSKPIAIGVFPDQAIDDRASFAQIVFGSADGYFVKTWATTRKPEDAGTISTSTRPQGTDDTDAWAVPLAVDPRGRSAIMTGPIDGTGQVAGRVGANVLWAYVCGNYEDGSPGNRIMKGHNTTVVSAAWSKEGSTALTGDAQGRVIEWNPTRLTEAGKLGGMKELRRHEFGGRVAALAVSDNGKRMAAYVLGKQGRIYVWNAGEPGVKLAPIHTESTDLSGRNAFASIAMSPDGQQLAACAGDRDWLEKPVELTGKIRLWNFDASPSQQPAPKLAFVNPHGNGRGTDFIIPNNNVIYSTSTKKARTLYFYDMEDGTILSAMSFGEDVSLSRLARSPERDWIVLGQDSDNKRFDAEIRHANIHPPRKTIPDCEQLLGLGNGGKELAVVRSGKIEMWNTTTGKLITQAPFPVKRIDASAFAPDGRLVVASENALVLWDWENHRHEYIDIGRKTTSLAFSPDGRFLAEGPESGSVQLRDLETRRVVRNFITDQQLSVPQLAFTQSGRVLVACDKKVSKNQSTNDASRPRIFLWDTADGSLAHQIEVPGIPQSFDISPNELYLVARVTNAEGSKLMGWRLDGKKIEPRRSNALPAAAPSQ